MKVTIPDQPGLKDTLMQIKRVSSGRVTLPALGGVKVTVSDTAQAVVLEATDLETAVKAWVEADVKDSGGGALVPIQGFYDVVRTLGKDHSIHLSTICAEEDKGGYDAGDATHLRLQQGDTDLQLRTLPLEDFPPLPEPASDAAWTDVSDAIPYLKLLADSCHNDRLQCQGAYVDGGRVCATDSYRLVRLNLHRDTGIHALVPHNTLEIMGKALDRGKWGAEHLQITGNDEQTCWRVPGGRFTWVARNVDADPLDYDKVLYDGTLPLAAEVPAEHLEAALKRAVKLTKGHANTPCVLRYDEESPDTLSIVTGNRDAYGEISEVVPVYTESGLMPEQAFDPDLLHDVLNLVGHDTWTFSQHAYNEQTNRWPQWKPALLESPPLTVVIMPMKRR